MSDEDFEKLLRKLGAESSPTALVKLFREAMERYDDVEDIDIITAKIWFLRRDSSNISYRG